MHQEIQDVLGQNFGIPDDIDEDELMEELDALEDDLTADTEANADGVPSYLQVIPSVSLHCWLSVVTFSNNNAYAILHRYQSKGCILSRYGDTGSILAVTGVSKVCIHGAQCILGSYGCRCCVLRESWCVQKIRQQGSDAIKHRRAIAYQQSRHMLRVLQQNLCINLWSIVC